MSAKNEKALRRTIRAYQKGKGNPITHLEVNPKQFAEMRTWNHSGRIRTILKANKGMSVLSGIAQYGSRLITLIDRVNDPQKELDRLKGLKEARKEIARTKAIYPPSDISTKPAHVQVRIKIIKNELAHLSVTDKRKFIRTGRIPVAA